MKTRFLFFLIIVVSFNVFSQNTEKIDSINAIILNAKNDTIIVDNLLLLGELYYTNYVDSATRCWEDAKKISEKINYKAGMADSYNNLAYIYDYMGNKPLALTYYLKTIPLDKEDKNFFVYP